jgi:hypothetical protein
MVAGLKTGRYIWRTPRGEGFVAALGMTGWVRGRGALLLVVFGYFRWAKLYCS